MLKDIKTNFTRGINMQNNKKILISIIILFGLLSAVSCKQNDVDAENDNLGAKTPADSQGVHENKKTAYLFMEDWDELNTNNEHYNSPVVNGFIPVAESDVLELYVKWRPRASDKWGMVERPGNINIAVRDKRNGFVWYQSPQNELLSRDGMTSEQADILDSMLYIHTMNLNENNDVITGESILNNSPNISYSKLDDGRDGIQITFDVDRFYFEIGMELWLEYDTLIVSVPYETIKEGKGCEELLEVKKSSIRDFIDYGHVIAEVMLEDLSMTKYIVRQKRLIKRSIILKKNLIKSMMLSELILL